VLAFRIFTAFPVVPVDACPEVVPGFVVAPLDQVAGGLPAFRRARRVAPRRARIVALAGGELEEERRGIQAVLLRELEDLHELLVDLALEEEMVLLDFFVVVAGREENAVDADARQEGAHFLDLVDAGLAVDRGVGAYGIATAFAFFDPFDRLLEDAGAVATEIVRPL